MCSNCTRAIMASVLAYVCVCLCGMCVCICVCVDGVWYEVILLPHPLQCMSVVVKVLPSQDPAQYHLYTKGAPEKVKKMCIPETGSNKLP